MEFNRSGNMNNTIRLAEGEEMKIFVLLIISKAQPALTSLSNPQVDKILIQIYKVIFYFSYLLHEAWLLASYLVTLLQGY